MPTFIYYVYGLWLCLWKCFFVPLDKCSCLSFILNNIAWRKSRMNNGHIIPCWASQKFKKSCHFIFLLFLPPSLFLYRNLSISLSIFSLSHSHICLRREDWAFTIFSVCHLFLINLFILSEELTVNINLRSPSLLQASKFSHSFFLLIPL